MNDAPRVRVSGAATRRALGVRAGEVVAGGAAHDEVHLEAAQGLRARRASRGRAPVRARLRVLLDPAPRPLFRLRGASSLRFTSVRGLQLHVLAVLSSVDDGSDDRAASLALVVSPRRDDGARLRRMEVDATRIRRAGKKHAIER